MRDITQDFFWGGGGEVTIPAYAGFVLFGGILCLHILKCMDRKRKELYYMIRSK